MSRPYKGWIIQRDGWVFGGVSARHPKHGVIVAYSIKAVKRLIDGTKR